MTDTVTKTYHVAVIERTLAYYKVEAEGPRAAAENWSDGDFYDRDDEALDTEGPTIVRERQPDGTWRRVPPSEWEYEPAPAVAAPVPGPGAHTPEPWGYDEATGRIYLADGDVEPTIAWVELENATTDQSKADGHLLAAAPKLLSACRMVIERWERGDLAEAARTCSAAIAEAEMAVTRTATSDPVRRPYSVLLMWPRYLTDGYDATFYARVEARDSVEAVALAKGQALSANRWGEADPADFAPLLVIEGHHHEQPMTND